MAEVDRLQAAESRIEQTGRSGAATLDLSNLGLAALPDALLRLTQLQDLDLSGNQLTALPEAVGQLNSLRYLFLHGNGALGIPPEILGPESHDVLLRGAEQVPPANILQFYFTRTREPARQLNEAKILVVGQGSVGKTSLVKRLIFNIFDPDEKKLRASISFTGLSVTQLSATTGGHNFV